jgi:hypothetical protein
MVADNEHSRCYIFAPHAHQPEPHLRTSRLFCCASLPRCAMRPSLYHVCPKGMLPMRWLKLSNPGGAHCFLTLTHCHSAASRCQCSHRTRITIRRAGSCCST